MLMARRKIVLAKAAKNSTLGRDGEGRRLLQAADSSVLSGKQIWLRPDRLRISIQQTRFFVKAESKAVTRVILRF
jgi:hypothetical protein